MKKLYLASLLLSFCVGIIFANGSQDNTATEKTSSDYPKRNINVIVQYSAGGPTDLSIRSLLGVAKTGLPNGNSFAVSNVTGGAGLIGLTRFAYSKNDGYTLGVPNIDLAINYAMGKTKINPADLQIIAMALADPYTLIVSSKEKFSDFKGFVEYVKANPGELIVGDSGVGSAPYLCAVAVEKAFDLNLLHVSFDGTADIITSVANGTCDVMFIQPGSAASQISAGTMKMLCTFSDNRMTTWPDIPTAKESYPDLNLALIGWVCIAAPNGTDPQIVSYLRNLIGTASMSDKYADNLRKLNMQPITMKPEELNDFIKNQVQFYQNLCKDIEEK